MTTPPIELAATVERVEMPTVEEIHEATTRILADPLLHKVVDWIGVSMREVGRHYTPAPSPAETGAVPDVCDVSLAVDALDIAVDRWERDTMEYRGYKGARDRLRAWLATQKVTR